MRLMFCFKSVANSQKKVAVLVAQIDLVISSINKFMRSPLKIINKDHPYLHPREISPCQCAQCAQCAQCDDWLGHFNNAISLKRV